MKRLKILGAIAFAICAISATVWSARYAPWVEKKTNRPYDPKIARRRKAEEDVKKLNVGILPDSLDTSVTGPVDTPPVVATQPPFPKV
jgi:hypothetical protein